VTTEQLRAVAALHQSRMEHKSTQSDWRHKHFNWRYKAKDGSTVYCRRETIKCLLRFFKLPLKIMRALSR
jgi:hypothetical protein